MRNKALSRGMIALLLVLLPFAMSGCLGPFNLTTDLHDWNSTASEEKWVNELIFLGLVIIPVYEFALLIDAIILNSIEFWGGKNPVDGNEQVIDTKDPAKGAQPFPEVSG